jgi:hypothetical protein
MQTTLQAPAAPFIVLRANLGAIAAMHIPWGSQSTLFINERLSRAQTEMLMRRVSLARSDCAQIIRLEGEEQCANL